MLRLAFTMSSYRFLLCGLLGIAALLGACTREPRYGAPPMEGAHVAIPLASLPLDEPRFYSYRVQGKDVNFFVLRTHDRVLSFLDACLTCYNRKLGYAAEHGYVVCRACDTRYALSKLEKGIGGCYPIRLEGARDKERYLIARSSLERRAGRF